MSVQGRQRQVARRLAGKVAIVTGAARGMGAATARLFAAEGAQVVLADVLDSAGQAVAREIGDSAWFQHHDVSDDDSWTQLVSSAIERLGRVDVLINNAGILSMQRLLDTSKREFEKILAVNLVGVFLGIKSVAPHMTRRGSGAIVNISSISGMTGQAGVGAYAASKWGVRGLTRVAALELGHSGVRVNSIYPGGTRTDMGAPRDISPEDLNRFYATIPLRRIGEPEDIAHACLYLVSDESSYVTGAELVVDGGLSSGLDAHSASSTR
jgi:3alpha(or 20beta)-hydroxysteroid dehydrogenase